MLLRVMNLRLKFVVSNFKSLRFTKSMKLSDSIIYLRFMNLRYQI